MTPTCAAPPGPRSRPGSACRGPWRSSATRSPSTSAAPAQRTRTCVPSVPIPQNPVDQGGTVTLKVGINGFGRIGRNFLRAAIEQNADIQIVGVNDLTDNASLANLIKYDSIGGVLPLDVSHDENSITVGDQVIKAYAERDPKNIPWGEIGADVVVESTGIFTDAEKAKAHIKAGVRKVSTSAPTMNEVASFVICVKKGDYDPDAHHICANATRTTDRLAPVAKVLNEEFGNVTCPMATVHPYTPDQV